MRYGILLIILVLFAGQVHGQQSCVCPSGTIIGDVPTPSRVYKFGDQTIAMCGGFTETDSILSEFFLYDCKANKIIGEWDATQSCTIVKTKDTITVSTLYNWPIGKNYEFNNVPFYISKFYYADGNVNELNYYINNYRRYSTQEIQNILTNYQNYKPGNNSETTMNFAYLLFWSYVSGSKEAEKYLNMLEAKCGPFDGGISEEWNDIITTYFHYKELAGKGLVQTN